jgi:hypothetical protein
MNDHHLSNIPIFFIKKTLGSSVGAHPQCFSYQFCDEAKVMIIRRKIYQNMATTIYESKKILTSFYIFCYLLEPCVEFW